MNGMEGAIGLRFPRQRTPITSPVFGALLFVFVEVMFFSALISSYFVIKRGREVWDIPGTVHLPTVAAGFNAAILLLSGLYLFLAGRGRAANVRGHVLRALLLGSFFLMYQIHLGSELVRAGLTMTSSIFGGCYFLIVGAHGLQVLLGILAMTKLYLDLNKKINLSLLKAVQVFWLFVVASWPILYAQIYF